MVEMNPSELSGGSGLYRSRETVDVVRLTENQKSSFLSQMIEWASDATNEQRGNSVIIYLQILFADYLVQIGKIENPNVFAMRDDQLKPGERSLSAEYRQMWDGQGHREEVLGILVKDDAEAEMQRYFEKLTQTLYPPATVH